MPEYQIHGIATRLFLESPLNTAILAGCGPQWMAANEANNLFNGLAYED